MKITGQTLKENREKQGLTINEVAIMIKVNTKTVRAIEEGDLDNLPAKTFLRGFVRSYAKLLKLNVGEVMSAFYEEMGSTKPKLAIRDQDNEEKRKKALEESMEGEGSPLIKKLIWTGISVFAIILIAFVLRQVEKYENESKPPEEAPQVKAIEASLEQPTLTDEEGKEDPPVSTDAAAPAAESTAPPATPAPEATKTPAPTAAAIPSTSTAAPSLTAAAAGKPADTKPAEPVKTSETAAPAPEPEKKEFAKSAEGTQEVILEAFDKVTVTYTISGKGKSTISLKEDDIRVIKGVGPIKISISDGGSVNVVHNGKDLGVPGSLGAPIDLNFK